MFDMTLLLVFAGVCGGAAVGVSVAVFLLPPVAAVPVGLVAGAIVGGVAMWLATA